MRTPHTQTKLCAKFYAFEHKVSKFYDNFQHFSIKLLHFATFNFCNYYVSFGGQEIFFEDLSGLVPLK